MAGRAPTRRREPLSRDRVLAAAVTLADRAGIAAVSMRRLADQLGVVPMALYKHVADKEELLDGMVDAVIREFAPAPRSPDWARGARSRILAVRRVVGRHPWARQVIESRTRRTPEVLGYMDSVAGTFLAGGLSADLTHHAMHALGNRIWGFSPELFDESRAAPASPSPSGHGPAAPNEEAIREAAARYPHILAIALAATGGDLSGAGGGCDDQFEFEFALDLLLDGVRRLHEAGWTSG